MSVTLIVEPDNGGHRFQAVANVAELAARTGEVVLLTSRGATLTEEFDTYLAGVAMTVHEPFDGIHPPTRQIALAVADYHRDHDVSQALVMDADQSLKRWWYVAFTEFRGLPRRPRVVFMLTRYPAKLALTDRTGWTLRLSKGTLALLAMSTRTLHRVAGFAGREDMSPGRLVKRARDPAICTAHARDRDRIRADLRLPAGRRLVGVFGVIYERKNVPLTLEAMLATGADADLLLAGLIKPEVARWLDALPERTRHRIIVREGFLPNDLLDSLVAASDVCVIALTNNGPSGIMGKALAAGVPVISAGSTVRAREIAATGGGFHTELTAAGLTEGMRRVFADDLPVPNAAIPPATAEAFAAVLLGLKPAVQTHRSR